MQKSGKEGKKLFTILDRVGLYFGNVWRSGRATGVGENECVSWKKGASFMAPVKLLAETKILLGGKWG